MSYGINVLDSRGQIILDTSNYGFALIDKFSVSPTSSGFIDYQGMTGVGIIVSQTQQEPFTTTKAVLKAQNSVVVSVTSPNADTRRVSWSPGIQQGLLHNVDLFVIGV